MLIDDHIKETIKFFGEPFVEVHLFLDQFYKNVGAKHRQYFHHKQGLELIRKKFGNKAVKVAERHIISDLENCGRWKLGIDKFPEKQEDYKRKLMW